MNREQAKKRLDEYYEERKDITNFDAGPVTSDETHYFAKIEAALIDSLTTAHALRPMETAPRDGTKIRAVREVTVSYDKDFPQRDYKWKRGIRHYSNRGFKGWLPLPEVEDGEGKGVMGDD